MGIVERREERFALAPDFSEQFSAVQEALMRMDVDAAEIDLKLGDDGRLRPIIKSVKMERQREQPIQAVAQADPSNVQEVAASQLEISNSYYESVLHQAKQSFRSAIVAGGIGFAFFLAAVAFVIAREQADAAVISAISGGIAQAIAALNFWLYGKTAQQLDAFHVRLEQTQRFLLANSVCQGLADSERNAAREKLVALIATHMTAPSQSPH
jgi:Cyanobacterial TRADD-N associated 2-Transmembrane domain